MDDATAPFEALPVSPPALVALATDLPAPDTVPDVPDPGVAQGPVEPGPGALDGPPIPLNGDAGPGGCTPAQMRRFIKSRPWIPMHELRRRFGIDGGDDVVTPVRLEPGWVYVGLPMREGGLLGELLKAGEIGYELSLDPRTPIVIGVYPMRPIPRN